MIWDYLTILNNEGKTILLTTHYIEEAEKLCNEIAIINDGQIIKHGDTKSIIKEVSLNTIEIELVDVSKLSLPNNIEYEMHTAGEYKRTITMFGENTDEGREKFKDDLANIHELFKKHVAKYRPSLDVNKVATGEVWQGIEAIEVGLVDKIQTSDSYLIEQNKKFDIFEVSFKPKKNMQDRFSRFLSFSITRTINKIFENFSKQKFM